MKKIKILFSEQIEEDFLRVFGITLKDCEGQLITGRFDLLTFEEKTEVLDAQQQWAEGIVAIGNAYQQQKDYKAKAAQHIHDLYAYDMGSVLFKPTLASNDQFRNSFDEALSYFVGGMVAEDRGFAIRPWGNVRFGEQEILTDSDSATAMGNYFFTPAGGNEETKVEYTFGYIKDENGSLRINVHHSSLPYEEK